MSSALKARSIVNAFIVLRRYDRRCNRRGTVDLVTAIAAALGQVLVWA